MSNQTEGPIAKAFNQVFDGLKCWAIHIEGPDDLIPAPSKDLAQFAADVTNRWLCEAAGEAYPSARAVVVEWMHGYEEWKVSSEQFAAEWADWIKRYEAENRAAASRAG